MSDRYEKLRAVAKALSLDAIALVPSANFERLFNASFHQHERPLMVLVPVDGSPIAIVPNLELGSFHTIGFEGEVIDWRDQDGYQSAFNTAFSRLPVKRIGVEGQAMRVFVHHAIQAADSHIDIIDTQKAIAALRLCKNEQEITALKKAISVSERALQNTIDQVRVGMSEKQIESVLVQSLFAAGADEMSFQPIVAAADNSAKPHATARADYAVQAGDALLIDFGARVDGLCADITRTFFIQHCSDDQRAVYETVLAANEAGCSIVASGVSAHDVDDKTTAVLEDSPYSDRIRTRTGHGLGRDVHEDPYIMRGNHESLTPGMVFTIEPGLYQEGGFGVRIEDNILVTQNGCDVLTGFNKSLTLIG